MRWLHWFRNGLTQPRTDRISRPWPPGRGHLCPRLERCEDRRQLGGRLERLMRVISQPSLPPLVHPMVVGCIWPAAP
jgi:hypothetical protein